MCLPGWELRLPAEFLCKECGINTPLDFGRGGSPLEVTRQEVAVLGLEVGSAQPESLLMAALYGSLPPSLEWKLLPLPAPH